MLVHEQSNFLGFGRFLILWAMQSGNLQKSLLNANELICLETELDQGKQQIIWHGSCSSVGWNHRGVLWFDVPGIRPPRECKCFKACKFQDPNFLTWNWSLTSILTPHERNRKDHWRPINFRLKLRKPGLGCLTLLQNH